VTVDVEAIRGLLAKYEALTVHERRFRQLAMRRREIETVVAQRFATVPLSLITAAKARRPQMLHCLDLR